MVTTDSRSKGISWLELLVIAGVFAVVAAIVYPMFPICPKPSRRTACLNNLKQLGNAMHMYMEDWHGSFPVLYTKAQRAPEGRAWPDALKPHIKNEHVFRCPKSEDRLTYSFNRRLSGLREKDVLAPADTVLIFESVSNSPKNNNLNGDRVWYYSNGKLPKVGSFVAARSGAELDHPKRPDWALPNHDDVNLVLHTDGHVKYVAYIEPDIKLIFSPKESPPKPVEPLEN